MIVHGLHASWCVRWLAARKSSMRLCVYVCVFERDGERMQQRGRANVRACRCTCASESVCYSPYQNRYTYDRSQIALWIQRAQQKDQEIRSPHTNEVLAHEMLTPNHSLRNIIMQNAIV